MDWLINEKQRKIDEVNENTVLDCVKRRFGHCVQTLGQPRASLHRAHPGPRRLPLVPPVAMVGLHPPGLRQTMLLLQLQLQPQRPRLTPPLHTDRRATRPPPGQLPHASNAVRASALEARARGRGRPASVAVASRTVAARPTAQPHPRCATCVVRLGIRRSSPTRMATRSPRAGLYLSTSGESSPPTRLSATSLALGCPRRG